MSMAVHSKKKPCNSKLAKACLMYAPERVVSGMPSTSRAQHITCTAIVATLRAQSNLT